MSTIHFTRAVLRRGDGASSLARFLAEASERIGRGHQLVWSLFGDHGRVRPFLYRGLGANASDGYLIYSAAPPEDRHGLWTLDRCDFTLPDRLRTGDLVAWSLRVNAVVKSGGKRHDVAVRALRHWKAGAVPEPRPSVEQLAADVVPQWLAHRLVGHGLTCEPARMILEAHRREHFLRNAGDKERDPHKQVVVWMSDVAGIGEVTDTGALQAAVRAGIGGARGYGCGMLLLRRA